MPPYGVCRVLPSETHQDLSQLVCVCRMRRALGREQTWLSWPGEAGARAGRLILVRSAGSLPPSGSAQTGLDELTGVRPSGLRRLRLWGGALGGPGGRPSV